MSDPTDVKRPPGAPAPGGEHRAQSKDLTGRPERELSLSKETRGLESREAPYHERKDSRITTLAIGVIALAAGSSAVSLLLREWNPDRFPTATDWPVDLFTLALVASLSFVMGSNGKKGPDQ